MFKTHMPLALALAGALLLSACGGSNSGGSTGPAQTTPMEDQPTPAEQAADAKKAYNDAVTALAAAQAALMSAEASQQAATTEPARLQANTAVGEASAAVTAAQANVATTMAAWKAADPQGYQLAMVQAENDRLKKEAADKAKAEADAAKAKADAAKAKADADAAKAKADADAKAQAAAAAAALAAQVTQIDPGDDFMVTPVRDSNGNITGIMVGDTTVSTVRFAQNEGTINTDTARGTMMVTGDAQRVGSKVANGGIMAHHVESYATTSTAMKVKVDDNDTPDDATDDVTSLDFSEVDADDPGGKPISVPSGIAATDYITTVADANYEADDDQTAPTFDLDNDAATAGTTVIVSTGTGDKMKYFIQVKTVTAAEAADEESDYFGYAAETDLYVEVPAVMVEDKTKLDRDKAMGFDYIAYGVWAEVDEDGSLAMLGNGYLIAEPSMRTPVGNIPVTGSATFEGQYASHIKKMGSAGRLSTMVGDVEMTANFGRDQMTVKLIDQFGDGNDLTLTGAIEGNTFAGTGAKFDDNKYLDSDGATAKLAGSFYGMKLDEAGGVYDVLGGSSKNPGQVVGAFGGVNTSN